MSEEGAQLYFFLGCLLAFFGAVMAVFFVVVVRKKIALRSWLPTAATVVESEVYWGSEGKGQKWLPRFAYEYEVGGRVYMGRHTDFFRRRTGYSAQELVARHPVGSLVRVFYDPKRPAEAVINREECRPSGFCPSPRSPAPRSPPSCSRCRRGWAIEAASDEDREPAPSRARRRVACFGRREGRKLRCQSH